ncbi:hypothetical protein BASA61_003261 [Batrachochytrium salamandrivorans]|nr:hypothetical protein BASA62_009442 [Batrachochytrium salamandrivorans]KAH6597126.1 hypothetical protein BASA61_003261 [Batrachochytrium salamandrivorans]
MGEDNPYLAHIYKRRHRGSRKSHVLTGSNRARGIYESNDGSAESRQPCVEGHDLRNTYYSQEAHSQLDSYTQDPHANEMPSWRQARLPLETTSIQKVSTVDWKSEKQGRHGETQKHRDRSTIPQVDRIFPYGNYSSYYGKREMSSRLDPRIAAFNPEWFERRRVLDIGCNSGWMTVSIGMVFKPTLIEGVDIDPTLIKKSQARLTFRASACKMHAVQEIQICHGGTTTSDGGSAQADFDYFPISCALTFAPIPVVYSHMSEAAAGSHLITTDPEQQDYETDQSYIDVERKGSIEEIPIQQEPPFNHFRNGMFPSNVRFRAGDWLHEPSARNDGDRYHTILALSITKWIHLNSGDSGIRHFFRKCYQSLLPGGRLIIEPQRFDTYSKRANLTPMIRYNYNRIKFKPSEFATYLLSDEVGFSSILSIDPPLAQSTGFSREIFVFTK